eukprot:scaffold173114_cov30-Tisochrysis_lutea.AAC.1
MGGYRPAGYSGHFAGYLGCPKQGMSAKTKSSLQQENHGRRHLAPKTKSGVSSVSIAAATLNSRNVIFAHVIVILCEPFGIRVAWEGHCWLLAGERAPISRAPASL